MKKESRTASVAYILVSVMLFLLVAGIVVGGIGLVHDLVSGGSVPIHAELEHVRVSSLPGLRIVAGPDATIEIHDATAEQHLLSAATSVGPALLLGIALWLLRASAFGGVGLDGFRFPFPLLLAGLGAFILAEVFARGVALREDVEATI
jgi:hypothetical protein